MTSPSTRADATAAAAAAVTTGAVTREQLRWAMYPALRSAALTLAVAQRDVAICRASSPAEIADQPDVTDPDAAYASWLRLMTDSVRLARASVLDSIAATAVWHDRHGEPSGPLADIARFALRRARAAIELMLGDDLAAAAAAREDVLHVWPVDDDLLRAAAGFPRPVTGWAWEDC